MNFSNSASDIIFTDFVHSVETDANLEYIESELKRISEDSQGTSRSSRGGYHSDLYDHNHKCGSGVLEELIDGATWYSTEYLRSNYSGFKQSVALNNWWFMINSKGDYNVPHAHSNTDLSMVFYVKTPEDCGELVLQRNDGARYTNLPLQKYFNITPKAGRLYIFPAHIVHWVEASQADTERISIVANLCIS